MSKVSSNPPTVSMQWANTIESSRAATGTFSKLVERNSNASSDKVDKTEKLFVSYFSDRINKLGGELGIPLNQRQALNNAGLSALKEIMSETFDRAPEGKMKLKDFKELVKQANTLAFEKLSELDKTFGAPQTSPQIIPFKTKEGEVKITVMKPAPPIENLVLRGGGAKGIGNGAALIEMENAGVLKEVKHIVGTSAGALTSVGLACGMTAKEFNDFADKTDIGGLKGTPNNYKTVYPMIDTGKRVGHTAGNALLELDKVSANETHARLNKPGNWEKVVDAFNDNKITKEQFDHLKVLKEKPDFDSNRTGKMVTFSDLSAMSKIFPEVKELTLTGMNRTDSQLHYFDAQKTPDMPIAVAGRISMSIPVFFASVDYDAGGGKKTWVDGGVGSNMPSGAIMDGIKEEVDTAKMELDKAVKENNPSGIETASKKLEEATKKLNEATARTLLMTFDEGGKAYDKMSDPHKQKTTRGPLELLTGAIAGDTRFAFNKDKDTRNIRDAGPNVVVVHHGDIGTLDLEADEGRVKSATLESKMRTLEQLDLRRNQGIHEVFNSVDKVVSSFSREEIGKIALGGAPQRDSFTGPSGKQMYDIAKDIYDKCVDLNKTML